MRRWVVAASNWMLAWFISNIEHVVFVFQTHALSLRRSVSGRSKSFDQLLLEHRAAKEAALKAKQEAVAAASRGQHFNTACRPVHHHPHHHPLTPNAVVSSHTTLRTLHSTYVHHHCHNLLTFHTLFASIAWWILEYWWILDFLDLFSGLELFFGVELSLYN